MTPQQLTIAFMVAVGLLIAVYDGYVALTFPQATITNVVREWGREYPWVRWVVGGGMCYLFYHFFFE